MNAVWHVLFGISVVNFFIRNQNHSLISLIIIYFITIIFSTLPDVDLKMKSIIKHRTLTHSLLAIIILYYVFIGIERSVKGFNHNITLIALISYSSHIFLDIFSKKGISLFFPLSSRIRFYITPLIVKILIITLFVISFKMLI